MKCPNCGSRDIDFQEAGGQSVCMGCGTVVEESTIVSSIEFQETGDRSHVIGQFVAANCSKPYMSSSRMMGRHVDNRDSKEATLLNARRILSQISSTLRLPSIFVDRAHRLYQLALQRNYSVGRRQANILATCLYIICRQEKSPHLLIDFSDALQINVYSLGKAFLHFTKIININLEVIDPSLYIHRYADKLDFGDKMNSVVTSSLRVITRLKKDWIVMGRRPDGVCAAALLIAARAHEFSVTQDTMAQLFRISLDTIRKRLLEFRSTPSAQLTMQQFFQVDVDAGIEYDPPAYIRNTLIAAEEGDLEVTLQLDDGDETNDQANILPSDLVKDKVYNYQSEYETDADEEDGDDDDEEGEGGKGRNTRAKKRARLATRSKNGGFSYAIGDVNVTVPLPNLDRLKRPADVSLSRQREQISLYDDIYTEVYESMTAGTEGTEDVNAEALLAESKAVEESVQARMRSAQMKKASLLSTRRKNLLKEQHLVISVELGTSSQSQQASQSSATAAGGAAAATPAATTTSSVKSVRKSILHTDTGKLISLPERQEDEAEEDPSAPIELSDSELNGFLFTDEESLKRAALFKKAYGSFLEQRERKKRAREQAAASQDTDRYTQTGKLRKKFAKKVGVVGGANSSASQAAVAASRSSVKGASKKINYEALQGVFGEDGGFKVPELPSSALGSSTVRSVAADLPRLASHPGIPLTSAAASAAATAAIPSAGVPSSSGAASIPSATSVRIPVGVGLNKSKGLVQPGIPGTALGATATAAANPNAATGTKPTTTPAGKDKNALNASAIEEEYEDDDEFIDEPYGGYSEYYEEDYS